MEKLIVGDEWYGRIGTVYEGVRATVERVTPHRVQVTFDKKMIVNGNKLGGMVFGKENFVRLFRRQQYEQLNLFEWQKKEP